MYHADAMENVPQLGVKGLGFYIVKALQLGLITWTLTLKGHMLSWYHIQNLF